MADAAKVRTLHSQLGFSGADRLYRVARTELHLDMPAKELRALAKRVASEESSKQVIAPRAPFDGKIASRVLDDRWAADLIDYKHHPHKTASGVYKAVLVVQDIFSREVWTRVLVDENNITSVFLKFLGEVERKPRQLITDGASIFTARAFQGMMREQDMEHQVKTSVNDIATVDRAIGQLKVQISLLAQQPGNAGNWYDNIERATEELNGKESRYLKTAAGPATPESVIYDDKLRFELRRKNARFMEHNATNAKGRREKLDLAGAFRTLLAGPLSTEKIRKGKPVWTAETHEVQATDGNLVTDTKGKAYETRQLLAIPKTSTAVQTPAYFAGGSVLKDTKRRKVMDPHVPVLLAYLRTKTDRKMSLRAADLYMRTKGTFKSDLLSQKMTVVKQFLKLYPAVFKVDASYVTDASPPPAIRTRWKSLTLRAPPAPPAPAPAPAVAAPPAAAPPAAAPAAPAPAAPAAAPAARVRAPRVNRTRPVGEAERELVWRQRRRAQLEAEAAGAAPETADERKARLAVGLAASAAVRARARAGAAG